MPSVAKIARTSRTALVPRPALSLTALLMMSTALLAHPAQAQEALRAGEAFATRFSGTVTVPLAGGDTAAFIDEAGVVGSVVDLRQPGFSADGRHWIDEPQRIEVTAGDVGQVFGVAIDRQSPASVYLTATSAFGLHQFDDGSDWLPGMWGEGGPGGLYKLDGASGYQPELLATITLDGRENTGAGLGNVAHDAAHDQLFVSDLETGMIHRIGMDGADLGRFDHGVDGRAAEGLDAVAFDPDTGARRADCPEPAGFSQSPGCWNFADFRRRVFGLALHTDASGQTRLYYAVWGSEGFGAPEFEGAGEDAMNSVWSVGLDASGAFDAADVRREFTVPDMGADDTARSVSDLAISPEGEMLVAERGGIRNLGLEPPEAFSVPHAARVLRYRLGADGAWAPDGRYDVGFAARQDVGAPYIRANAAGGVDFGYAYDTGGAIDASRPYGQVWATGDALCSPEGPCTDPATGQRTDDSEVHGLQGTPREASVEVLPAGSAVAPAAGADPYPADGPLASYMIDLDRNVDDGGAPLAVEALRNDATRIGDVEVHKASGGGSSFGWGYMPPGGYDLSVDKSGTLSCLTGADCVFTIRITNISGAIYAGPLYLWDVMQPGPGVLVSTSGEGWLCRDGGYGIFCGHDGVSLEIGAWVEFTVTIQIPDRYAEDIMTNCVSLVWLYGDDGQIDVRSVQIALTMLGYDVGPIDGVMGGSTRNAIARFQIDQGLDDTGVMDLETAELLFPGMTGVGSDLVLVDNTDCHTVDIGDPRPVHTKWRSHLKVASPHDKRASHLKNGSPHDKRASHLKNGSPHDKRASHRKVGSPHDKRASHQKVGSHTKSLSHVKNGSGHDRRQSHAKTGSNRPEHSKKRSHWKSASRGVQPEHSKVRSHMKSGSRNPTPGANGRPQRPDHGNRQSHAKTGSGRPQVN